MTTIIAAPPAPPSGLSGETYTYLLAVRDWSLKQLQAIAAAVDANKAASDAVNAAVATHLAAIDTGLAGLQQQLAALPPIPAPVDLQALKDAVNALIARGTSGLQYLSDLGAFRALDKKLDADLAAIAQQPPIPPVS